MKILEILGSLAPIARPWAPRSAPPRSRPAQPAVPVAGRLASALGLLRGLPTSLGTAKEVPRNYEDFNVISIGFSHDFIGFL